MERLRFSAKTFALIAVAILVAAGTYAVASIPGSDGVITACWDHTAGATYGALRVIDPSLAGTTRSTNESSCQSNETQITWNQQGAIGPVGPVGPSGPQGPQGARAPSSALMFQGGGKPIFLKIGDIQGESSAKGHKDEIILESVSLGGGGGSAGRVNTGEIIIVKHVDKSSPKLFQATATGRHFQTATITFRKAGGRQPVDYLKFKMTNVIISSLKSSSGQGSSTTPTEQVTLTFKKIEVVYLANHSNHSTSINLTPHQFALP